MKNYQITILIHPDQSERLQSIIKKCKSIIENKEGKIKILEDLGKKHLSYQIKKMHKAHYVFMDIECNTETITELSSSFRLNDSIIRNLIIRINK
jgi:small subunit ribosomal protein S6